ncbi:FCD domain-containing protein [Puniceibacterium sp. IMCC21224]|uniref:FCD domain-containing protein n=1 Tax=Puniceibacterium sp. IMCC21224 TaxID=1618204 RepID=UPI0018CF88BE|nr:FCD domain-containing protein [Puniceibacterium sp. IMCC21224]
MSEDLVEILTTDIRNGIYEEGDSLPSERTMVEEFGVSRITVREALASLERSGLIAQHPGMRAKVRIPDSATVVEMLSGAATLQLAQSGGVEHFQDVRTLVETGVVQLAAERIDDTQIAHLRELLAQNQASLGDVEQFARTDMAFHAAIAEVLANPIILAFYLAVDRWLSDVRRTTLARDGQMETAFAAHCDIFKAIETRNPRDAQIAMRAHIEQVNRVYGGG